MSSFEILKWAFDLREVDPVDKLIAIYFGGHAGIGSDRCASMDIDILELAVWCGCNKEDAVIALGKLRPHGLESEESGIWRYKAILQLNAENEVVAPATRGEEILHLYVVSTASGIKIGISSNPKGRFKSLRNASPELMTVEFLASGPRRTIMWAEARCHSDLRPHHIRGEWFSCSAEIAVNVARAVLEEGGVKLPD